MPCVEIQELVSLSILALLIQSHEVLQSSNLERPHTVKLMIHRQQVNGTCGSPNTIARLVRSSKHGLCSSCKTRDTIKICSSLIRSNLLVFTACIQQWCITVIKKRSFSSQITVAYINVANIPRRWYQNPGDMAYYHHSIYTRLNLLKLFNYK